MSDFRASIDRTVVVVTHAVEGHVYHFPILTNGAVNLNGARIQTNHAAKTEARKFLFDAHTAACEAIRRHGEHTRGATA